MPVLHFSESELSMVRKALEVYKERITAGMYNNHLNTLQVHQLLLNRDAISLILEKVRRVAS